MMQRHLVVKVFDEKVSMAYDDMERRLIAAQASLSEGSGTYASYLFFSISPISLNRSNLFF